MTRDPRNRPIGVAQTTLGGLPLVPRWVSPPVAAPRERNVPWLLWRVKDAPTHYQLRAMTTTIAVEFGARADAILVKQLQDKY